MGPLCDSGRGQRSHPHMCPLFWDLERGTQGRVLASVAVTWTALWRIITLHSKSQIGYTSAVPSKFCPSLLSSVALQPPGQGKITIAADVHATPPSKFRVSPRSAEGYTPGTHDADRQPR